MVLVDEDLEHAGVGNAPGEARDALVVERRLEVVVIDPAYLAMQIGDSAHNLFAVGQALHYRYEARGYSDAAETAKRDADRARAEARAYSEALVAQDSSLRPVGQRAVERGGGGKTYSRPGRLPRSRH